MDFGMTETIINLRQLKATPGMVLTNGEVYNEDVIYLGINEDINTWYEITYEEYQEIEAKKQAQETNE
jgi:predicted RNA-binding protein